MRQIDDDARDDDARCNAALVGIRPENIDTFRLLGGLENTQAGSVGVLEDEVSAALNLRERLLFTDARIIPVPDVRREDSNARIDGVHPSGERQKAALDGRKIGSTDHTDDPRTREGAGDDAGQVRWLLETEDHRCDVRPRAIARRGDVDRVRIIRPNARRGVLEFEAVPEYEVVTLRAIRSEILLEIGGRFHLDMAYMCADTVANS